jgi:uncharacterized glyoxalase superfamily protein PhnB
MDNPSTPTRLPANRSAPPGVFIPVLPYPEVAAAVKWLCETFGFEERLRIGDHRSQLVFGGASIVVGASPQPIIGGQSVLVRVLDVDRHFEHAKQHGAKILRPPQDFPYGERQYTVEDFAGYRWTFSQSIADVDPRDWGGVLVNVAVNEP